MFKKILLIQVMLLSFLCSFGQVTVKLHTQDSSLTGNISTYSATSLNIDGHEYEFSKIDSIVFLDWAPEKLLGRLGKEDVRYELQNENERFEAGSGESDTERDRFASFQNRTFDGAEVSAQIQMLRRYQLKNDHRLINYARTGKRSLVLQLLGVAASGAAVVVGAPVLAGAGVVISLIGFIGQLSSYDEILNSKESNY